MGENSQPAASNAASGSSAAATAKMKQVAHLNSASAAKTTSGKSPSAADAETVAQTASDQWMNKMSDRFTQTMESGANSTLLPQDQLMAI